MAKTYPVGALPESTSSGVLSACLNCGKQMRITRWDSWNGFLVQCPHCRRLHGKRRNIGRLVMAGLLFNFLTIWFVMRPKNAATATAVLMLWFLLGQFVFSGEAPEIVEIVWLAGTFMIPILVVATVAVFHECLLGAFPHGLRVGRSTTPRRAPDRTMM